MTWLLYAFLSAFFAALTTILAKIGIKGIDSNIATAIRTIVLLIFSWMIVIAEGGFSHNMVIPKKTLLFIILSGITAGLSWIAYFKGLQVGDASKVAPVDKISMVLTILLACFILKEKITLQIISGASLMTIGAIIIALSK